MRLHAVAPLVIAAAIVAEEAAVGLQLASGSSQIATVAMPPGDAARGQAVVEDKGECLQCHRVRGRGSRFGPDLTEIGSRAGVAPARGTSAPPFERMPPDIGPLARARNELRESILNPGDEILPPNRTIRFVTRSGETGTARVLNQDTFSFQLIDTNERVRSIAKAELREFSFIKSSPMPSYKGKLTEQELADVIAYLMTLKGINK